MQLKTIFHVAALLAAALTVSGAAMRPAEGVPPVAPPAPPTLAEQVCAPYVAMVSPTADVWGAGTVLRLRGEIYILTAAHVVSDGEKAPEIGEIRHYATEKAPAEAREARLVAYSGPEDSPKPGDDLALLKPLNPAGLTPARLHPAPFPLERGEDLWYIGSPNGEIGHIERTIYSRSRDFKGKPFYIANGCGWFGNSGGGAYVKRGDRYFFIGVLTRILDGRWPKSPVMLETQDTIHRFLAAYKPAK